VPGQSTADYAFDLPEALIAQTPPEPRGASRLMERISAINPDKVFHTDFSACNAYANGEAAMRALACPALFLVAARDVMTPAKAAQSLIDACAQPTVVRIDGSGHSMMAEQPDAVLDALYGYARRHFTATVNVS